MHRPAAERRMKMRPDKAPWMKAITNKLEAHKIRREPFKPTPCFDHASLPIVHGRQPEQSWRMSHLASVLIVQRESSDGMPTPFALCCKQGRIVAHTVAPRFKAACDKSDL